MKTLCREAVAWFAPNSCLCDKAVASRYLKKFFLSILIFHFPICLTHIDVFSYNPFRLHVLSLLLACRLSGLTLPARARVARPACEAGGVPGLVM